MRVISKETDLGRLVMWCGVVAVAMAVPPNHHPLAFALLIAPLEMYGALFALHLSSFTCAGVCAMFDRWASSSENVYTDAFA